MIVITDQSGLQLVISLFPAFPRSDFMSILPQITYGNIALVVLSYFHDTKKIGINGMFLNVATFSVTKRSISSIKKKVFFNLIP
jgi:hypothetical protein